MPPPPPGFGGPPGASHVDEWQGRMPSPFDESFVNRDDHFAAPYDDHVQNRSKTSKDKNKNFGKERIEPSLKGYILVKAEPPLGQKATWARVNKRDLPFDNKNLITEIKTHQRKTGKKASTIFRELSLNQQGIVNRMVAQHILKDKNSNAEWVLADVQRFGVTRLGRLIETKKMQVILQRQLRGDDRKPGAVNASNARNYHEFGEIIDLAEPLSGKKDKDGAFKKGKKQQDWFDNTVQPVDVIYEPAGAQWAQQEPVYDVHANQHHHQQQHQPQQHQPIYDDPLPPPMAPFPGDPMAFAPQHDAQMPLPPLPQQYQAPYPAAHQNPFTPNLDIMPPGQYEHPQWDDQAPIRPRVHTPAADRKRSASARRLRKLETSVDYLARKVEDWNLSSGDSSEGHRDRDSIFSDPHTGGTKTPMSSLHSEDMFPRGEYDQRKREKSRDAERRQRKHRDEARERRYRDERIEAQEHHSHRNRRDSHRNRRDSRYESESPLGGVRYIKERERDREAQYSPTRSPIRDREPQYSSIREREREHERERRLSDTRPRFDPSYDREAPGFHHAQTYHDDDYPHPRSAVEPRLQRRLTDYPSENYHNADYDDQLRSSRRRRDSEARGGGDRGFGGLEYAPRRDEGRHARRQSAVEPLGKYYD
ncbi:hypothetical protein LTR91_002936 [Friedmanniomyces endolithicus]|uniref:Uncharacterized protein n=1 Tax=Friedmanniomyces endolithicus TaxID=329885 RepID=A0AAN6R030_9PEZI|nr:hypothetical protein LTR75_004233 [Friedmanniomyces endolithicus]KAK0850561.1 hypothetical protein LTR03_004533 [Friedmanniomyces endolithicus]KAK0866207.1 hypothetical protein LTS02_004939 [Friedmanniomyces endolithicus]KAK0914831.1 hypothetical protein LTR02_001566 [Friedmanniomyces endolithicus]KAK0925987.1 hypothetical protein LTR57_004591 [Friedmanniomyces endolithicus]